MKNTNPLDLVKNNSNQLELRELKELVEEIINSPAFENLENEQQRCDEDGVMVQVSRQALNETLQAIKGIIINK